MPDQTDVTLPNKVAQRRISPFVVASAIVVSSIVVISTGEVARTSSATWDETLYLYLGRQAVLFDGGAEYFAALGVAPLPVRLTWTRSILEPVDLVHNDPSVFRARVDRARQRAVWWFAVPMILGILIWVTAGHGVATGFVAAALVSLSPNVIAHASLATTDVAFVATFVLTLAMLAIYLRSASLTSASGLGLALGIALATKYSALALLITVALLFVWRRRERRWTLDAFAIGSGLLVAWAAHGFATAPLATHGGVADQLAHRLLGLTGYAGAVSHWLTSLQVPILARGIAAQAYLERTGQESFLMGQTSLSGWWYYFPVALSLKSTPVELVAFVTFITLAIVRRGRDVETQVLTTAALVFGGLALAGRRDLGIRYVLPLVVVALIGAVAWASEGMRNRKSAAAVAVIALMMQAFSFFSVAPQQLAYFNAFSGGPSKGYTRLVDSNLDWGQDLPRLADWMKARGVDRVSLAYFGSAPVQAYGINTADWRHLDATGDTARPKWFVISATYYQGMFVCGDPFAGLRVIEPSDRIGYSMMAYATDREDVRKALAVASVDPCAP